MRIRFLIGLMLSAVASVVSAAPARPNIVYILCDDLGYGDVQCLNPQRGKIATPNIDRLAAQGILFTDAHSGSSVCTPTRYGILTGRYCWRSKLQSSVLLGNDPPLISPARLTVPAFLKQHGYATACIGKWHLGMTFGKDKFVDPIVDGPTHHGFDSYYGISASLDMPPYVYIENDRFTQIPTVEKKWIRSGPAAKDFEAIDVLPALTQKAVQTINARAADAKTGKPFFLYLALTSPHTPILPTPDFQGKSGLGAYGDFVMETDWAAGQVLKAIDDAGIGDNTLVIFTSDNGCSPAAGVANLEKQGHFPSGPYRGYKSDIWDGGHRVPFLARWPGHIRPATSSDQLACLTDLFSTCAALLEQKLPDDAAQDSFNLLPALLDQANAPIRDSVIHHSIHGNFAIRQGSWKLEICSGSGGWSKTAAANAQQETVQLYDLSKDPAEANNLASANPERVEAMKTLLEKQIANGRTTPGTTDKNDVAVDLFKATGKRGK